MRWPPALLLFGCLLPFSLGCMGGMGPVGSNSYTQPPDVALSSTDAYPFVLRFLEVEGPQAQPANYPGCVPGLPSTAIWGVAQNHPPLGFVEVDPAGASARVRFQWSPGPGGSHIDGAIKYTPLPAQNACQVDYEDLRFTYVDGTSTYRGSRKVKYDSNGAYGSRAQEDQHLTLTRREGVNESTYQIYCYTDYRSTPPAPQGFWVSMSIWQTLPSGSLASPEQPIRWSPECNYPISGNLNLGVSAFMASTSKATATFGPACSNLAIKPFNQPTVPMVLAPWPGP